MIKLHKTALAMLTLLTAASASFAAAPDFSAWSHTATVDLNIATDKGLAECELSPEVLAIAKPDGADLRLIKDGTLVPFLIRMDPGAAPTTTATYTGKLLNATFLPGSESSVTVDFGSRESRSVIEIHTPGQNFRRRVRIQASNDSTDWQILRATDWLFRISYENGSYEKAQVILPENDFRYLRITVYNAPDDPGQIAINSVFAFRQALPTPPQLEDQPALTTVSQDASLKATLIDADLGYANLPLHNLAFQVDDTIFLRRVEILGRNVKTRTVTQVAEDGSTRTRQEEEPWAYLAGGSLYRLPGEPGQPPITGLNIPLTGRSRYLQVRIYNADDKPLAFKGLKVDRYRVLMDFRPAGAGKYVLYAGNASAEMPQFDLVNYAKDLRAERLTRADLGALSANPLYAAPVKVIPWSEQHALALWAALGTAAALLILLVLRQARHARSAPSEPQDSTP